MLSSDTFYHKKRKFPNTDTDFFIKKKCGDCFSSEPSLVYFEKPGKSFTKIFMFFFYLWETIFVSKDYVMMIMILNLNLYSTETIEEYSKALYIKLKSMNKI